jgi:hypothetical protein
MYLCVRGIVTKPVPIQESERSCICVLGESVLPLSTIFLLDFGNISTVWDFLFVFHLIVRSTLTVNITVKYFGRIWEDVIIIIILVYKGYAFILNSFSIFIFPFSSVNLYQPVKYFTVIFTVKVRAYKTGLIPPLFIKVSVPIQKSERSCICVLGESVLPHFEKTQVKHKTSFISPETQYNDGTFVDKLLSLVQIMVI